MAFTGVMIKTIEIEEIICLIEQLGRPRQPRTSRAQHMRIGRR